MLMNVKKMVANFRYVAAGQACGEIFLGIGKYFRFKFARPSNWAIYVWVKPGQRYSEMRS